MATMSSKGPVSARACNECNLCCKLVPVAEIQKPANKKCKHQSHLQGCKIYPNRPRSCQSWNCAWLVDEDAADLRRPDRVHYVIDMVLDYVTAVDNETGKSFDIPAIQIWCDEKYPDAHRDPKLREYLAKHAKAGGAIGIVRYDSGRCFGLYPPELSGDGQWHEVAGNVIARDAAEEAIIRLSMRG